MVRANVRAGKISKTMIQNFLSNVPEEKVYRNQDGQIFRNLYELEKGLNNMTDEVYKYHANTEKNDFSAWISLVIGDEVLAKDLEKSSSRLDAAMKVESRIHYLISK